MSSVRAARAEGPGRGAAPGQSGVTMIEVLISVLLIAVGTLALTALQLSSKRSNLDAEQRQLAAQAGYGFLERIRGNSTRAGVDAYIAEAGAGFGGGQHGSAAPIPNCGAGAACDAAQMAAFDAWQFEQELDGAAVQIGANNAGGLLSPIACLASTAVGNDTVFDLTIVWRGNTEIPDEASVTCGQGTGNYGANDELRRTLTLSAFVRTQT